MIDSTFKIVPLNKYYQLLIIHIEYGNDVSFIIFFFKLSIWLLEIWFVNIASIVNLKFEASQANLKKTLVGFSLFCKNATNFNICNVNTISISIYRSFFLIIRYFTKLFHSFLGLRKAINEFYPGATLHGCWYHFCAAVRRKFLSLDMYELISKFPAAKLICRMLLCLPLLPAESIYNGYNIVKQEAIKEKLDKKFKKIFEYFEEYWLPLVSFYFSWNTINLIIFTTTQTLNASTVVLTKIFVL